MMASLPKLSIVLVTYQRTKEALITLRSTCKNLTYPKELRSFYIADDGSDPKHVNKILQVLREECEETVLGFHNERFRPEGAEESFSCGLGWNRGLGIAHQNSDYVLWLEDDWELEEQVDLVPYIRLLQQREDVGVVSFRVLSVGNEVLTVGHNGLHYLQYLKTTQYGYSGNPYLRHARFTKHYGWFREDCNPGEIELKMDDRYRLDEQNGPLIWRPVTISPWGAWSHVGTDKSYQ